MIQYEYKVIPAPARGVKGKGVKGPDARFANALESVMNEMGAQGWEYQRAETLPSEERAGLTGKNTIFRNLLVFRKSVEAAPLVTPPLETETGETENDTTAATASEIEDENEQDLPKEESEPEDVQHARDA